MTSLLLSAQTLTRINIDGRDEYFANKDLTIPPLGVNKPLDASKRYYLIVEVTTMQTYSYRVATHGTEIVVNDKPFNSIVFSTRGTQGQVFRFNGWIQGNSVRWQNYYRYEGWGIQNNTAHYKVSKFELYWN